MNGIVLLPEFRDRVVVVFEECGVNVVVGVYRELCV